MNSENLLQELQAENEAHQKHVDDLHHKINKALYLEYQEQSKTIDDNYNMGLITLKELSSQMIDIAKKLNKGTYVFKYE